MLAALSLFVCALALGASWQSSSADVLAEDDRKAADAFIKANDLGTSVIQIENMLTGARCGQCFGRCTLTARRARTDPLPCTLPGRCENVCYLTDEVRAEHSEQLASSSVKVAPKPEKAAREVSKLQNA